MECGKVTDMSHDVAISLIGGALKLQPKDESDIGNIFVPIFGRSEYDENYWTVEEGSIIPFEDRNGIWGLIYVIEYNVASSYLDTKVSIKDISNIVNNILSYNIVDPYSIKFQSLAWYNGSDCPFIY